MRVVKNIAKRIIPARYHEGLARLLGDTSPDFFIKSYSHEGEDMILKKIFEKNTTGFYVDVGAHHPYKYSNTCLFYNLGWRGINIDPLPGAMAAFNKLRPRDINLEIGISDSEEELVYYAFKEPALNTFSRTIAEERRSRNLEFVREIRKKVFPLAKVFDKHIKPGQRIDFLSIDVEGLEMKVLQSNEWDRYAPDVLLVECLDFDISMPEKSAAYVYLTGLGYRLIAMTLHTIFFISDAAHNRLQGDV